MNTYSIETGQESLGCRKMIRVQMLFILIGIGAFSVLEFWGMDAKSKSLGFTIPQMHHAFLCLSMAHLYGMCMTIPALASNAKDACHNNLMSRKTRNILYISMATVFLTQIPTFAIGIEKMKITAAPFIIILTIAEILTIWAYKRTPLKIQEPKNKK